MKKILLTIAIVVCGLTASAQPMTGQKKWRKTARLTAPF